MRGGLTVFGPPYHLEAGGYTWMAPSAQTQGASFTVGSVGTSQDPSEAQQQSSSLLFRMPKNPLRRTLKPVEEGFGQATLKAYDSLPTGFSDPV